MKKADWLTVGGALAVYASIFFNRFVFRAEYPNHLLAFTSWPVILLAAGTVMLTVGFYGIDMRRWLLLIVFFIPFEISAPLPHLGSLSPIDYFCASALLIFFLRFKLSGVWRECVESMGPSSLFFLCAFLCWGLFDASRQAGNPRTVLRWGEFFFIYVLASHVCRHAKNEWPRLLSTLVAGLGCVLACVGIVQFILAFGNYLAVTGTFQQHNVMAAFLSLSLFSAIALGQSSAKGSRVAKYLTGFILITLLATYSRGAWIGFAVGSLFVVGSLAQQRGYGWRGFFKRYRILLFALLFLCGCIILKSRSHLFAASGRKLYWQASARILKQHPFIGIGPGNYDSKIASYLYGQGLQIYAVDKIFADEPNFWVHLHNLYLQLAVDYGLVGLSLWLFCMGLLIRRALRTWKSHPTIVYVPCAMAACTAFLVHNCVDIMTVASLDLLFATYLASVAGSSPT